MASVGNDVVKLADPCVSYSTVGSQGTVYFLFFFCGHHDWWPNQIILPEMENLESAQGGWSYHVVSYGEAPTRKLRTMPIAFSGSGHTGKTNKLSDAVIHLKEESTHRVPKSASQAVLSMLQLTFHAPRRTHHGASRLVQAMSALVGENTTCSVPAF